MNMRRLIGVVLFAGCVALALASSTAWAWEHNDTTTTTQAKQETTTTPPTSVEASTTVATRATTTTTVASSSSTTPTVTAVGPAVTARRARPAAAELPRTGSSSWPLALFAVALVLGGAGLIVAPRVRRRP